MFRRAIIFGIMLVFLAACGGEIGSKNDPMRDWGTKKSTGKPLQDFPGGPADKK